jgi:hypothetical protein
MQESLIEYRVKEKEKEKIREIELRIGNILKKEINILQDRNAFMEENNETLVYEKVEVEQKTIDEENRKEHLEKTLAETKQRYHDLKIQNDILKIKEQHLIDKVTLFPSTQGRTSSSRIAKIEGKNTEIRKRNDQTQ